MAELLNNRGVFDIIIVFLRNETQAQHYASVILPFYPFQGKYAEAESHSKRAAEILEEALGPDHPNVATAFNNLAALLREQVRAVRSISTS